MFTPNWVIEKLLAAEHKAQEYIVKYSDLRLSQILEAKQNEVDFLNKQIVELTEQVAYQRERADQLVDRLLMRDGHVAPVTPMATQAIKTQVDKEKDRSKIVDEILESVNSVGEDLDNMPQPIKVVFAGGGETIRDNK